MSVNPLDRIRELGGELYLAGDRLKYRIPVGNPEARQLLTAIRQDREAVIAMLWDIESKPPSLEEVKVMLPTGIRVLRYEPNAVPFVVAPVSIVTSAGKFYRAYLRDLRWRVEHPGGAAPPLSDILAKLAEAGLELTLESSA